MRKHNQTCVPSSPQGDISRLQGLSRDILGIKLEPIVTLASSRQVGAEVLSVLASWQQNERFFRDQTPAQALMLLEAQLTALKNTRSRNNLFINLPITLFTQESTFRQVLRLPGPPLNIEIVDPAALFHLPVELREAVIRRMRQLRREGHRLWLDDVDESLIKPFLSCPLPLHGIKVDKVAFWRLRATPALSRLVASCSQVAAHVLIEGIETEQDRHFALQAGAELGQGYHWPARYWPAK